MPIGRLTMNKDIYQNDDDDEEHTGLHEECGVFGIYDLDGGDIASTIYYGLSALQHRGQESCGIAVSVTAVLRIILIPIRVWVL